MFQIKSECSCINSTETENIVSRYFLFEIVAVISAFQYNFPLFLFRQDGLLEIIIQRSVTLHARDNGKRCRWIP